MSLSEVRGEDRSEVRTEVRTEVSATISVSRALSILDAFLGEDRYLPLSELARRVELPKSTTFRLVNQLTESGYLTKVGRNYRLSARVFELGNTVDASPDGTLRDVAAPHMAALYEHVGFGVHLAVLDGTSIVYLDRIRGPRSPNVLSKIGARVPALTTALGKVILAHSGREEITNALAESWPRSTPYTVMPPGLMVGQLRQARETGVAFDREEALVGLACVAAPIFDPSGHPVGAISASGPSGRFRPESAVELTRRAARLISSDLKRTLSMTA